VSGLKVKDQSVPSQLRGFVVIKGGRLVPAMVGMELWLVGSDSSPLPNLEGKYGHHLLCVVRNTRGKELSKIFSLEYYFDPKNKKDIPIEDEEFDGVYAVYLGDGRTVMGPW